MNLSKLYKEIPKGTWKSNLADKNKSDHNLSEHPKNVNKFLGKKKGTKKRIRRKKSDA